MSILNENEISIVLNADEVLLLSKLLFAHTEQLIEQPRDHYMEQWHIVRSLLTKLMPQVSQQAANERMQEQGRKN